LISTLHIQNLRVLKDVSLEFSPGISALVGENGAGKTSVLEAISLLSTGRSFVSIKPRALIHTEASALMVFGRFGDRPELRHRGAIQLDRGGEKRLRLDGQGIGSQAEISRLLPVLVLAPSAQDLILGPPLIRRRLMDWGAFYVLGLDALCYSGFRRALLQRNMLLRSGTLPDGEDAAWCAQLDQFGRRIDAGREAFILRYIPYLQRILESLTFPHPIEVRYRRGWLEDVTLAEALAKSRVRDLKYRATHVGPQRADLELCVGGEPVADRLSRGQLKTLNVACVLAQMKALVMETGERPVLLLDDVGAELDLGFQSRVWAAVSQSGCQAITTGVDLVRAGLADYHPENVFHVKHGMISD
jgi:DNA replication and repair protein RecF